MNTPYILFALMRKLFVVSGGLTNDVVNFFISLIRPYQLPETQNGVLGTLSANEIRKVTQTIEEKGYYVFDIKLDEAAVEDLVTLAHEEECRPRKSDKKMKFGQASGYPRYDFESDALVKNGTICKLVTDPTLKAIAGTYLKSIPICDLIVMWWSTPAEKDFSEAAQMYHFDMDRLKFLKFFFYLTDVDENTGPHCYVESSHQNLPLSLRRDGRFTDEQIEKFYGREKIKKFTGKKGSIMAVDTRGMHKGERLKTGNRLIFQIEFSNSLFGMKYPYLHKENINPGFKDIFLNHAPTYMAIFK